MKIAGFIKNSFVDYPSQISSVVFTQGCNFNCHYCHNNQLIKFDKGCIDESEIFEYLKLRKGMIDAVVITGGEPTCQIDLIEFIKKVKQLGFLVKLDTNGSNFILLDQLINNKLVDYVAMDIKAPLNKYELIVGKNIDINIIKKSIKYLINSECGYEFRTTLSPKLSLKDILQICKEIKGARKIYFQNCNLNEKIDYPLNMQNKVVEFSKKYVNECIFRGF